MHRGQYHSNRDSLLPIHKLICHTPGDMIDKITTTSPPTSKKETVFSGCSGLLEDAHPKLPGDAKKNNSVWGPEQQQASEQIKQEIAHAMALGPVKTGQEIKNILCTAAGEKGPTWSLW